jgi:hypothetical protein
MLGHANQRGMSRGAVVSGDQWGLESVDRSPVSLTAFFLGENVAINAKLPPKCEVRYDTNDECLRLVPLTIATGHEASVS